jgi:hypothetical protein
MTRTQSILALLCFSAAACWLPPAARAQPRPAAALVNLYFPQIADGDFAGGRWQTALTLVNPNEEAVSATLRLFDDNGGGLRVDFGSGLGSQFDVTVPARGSLSVATAPSSLPVRSGWARVYADGPLLGSASFRLWLGGKAVQEVTAPSALPGLAYVSYANRDLGVAVANPNNRQLRVDAKLRLANGAELPSSRIVLPPFGHTAFNVKDRFPAATAQDSVLTLEAVDPPVDEFIAWTMNTDASGTFSSLPAGTVVPPYPHWDRLWNAFLRVGRVALSNDLLRTLPEFRILDGQEANAYAAGGKEIVVYLGLAELLGDSESDLAFVVAHELGHIVQQRTGIQLFHENEEFDADMWGALLALEAGYDPYGAAGALAKLAMATGSAGLMSQFEQQLSADAHKSFNTRLEEVYHFLVMVCNVNDETRAACRDYKRIMHPHLPDVPLSLPGLEKSGYRAPDLGKLREAVRRERAMRGAEPMQPPPDRSRPVPAGIR